MAINFDCPTCKTDKATRLIILPGSKRLTCNLCKGYIKPSVTSTAKYWSLMETDVKDDKTRVTKGKAWEIKNRVIGPDGRVYNRITGKDAQR